MRYATVTLDADGGFAGVSDALASAPDVSHEGITDISLQTDGSVLALVRLHGDLARAGELLRAQENVEQCEVVGTTAGFAYLHVDATDTVEELLAVQRATEVLIATPIEVQAPPWTDGAVLRVTVVGTDSAMQRAIDRAPAAVDVSLESIGEYAASPDSTGTELTERQREILETAVALGYYAVPRETTLAAVAERLDLAPGTVAEHLQKIEATVLPKIVE